MAKPGRDGHQIEHDYGDDRPRSRRGKVRLRTLDDLDHRTAAARKARDLVAGLENDLGGDPSTGQRELARRAAMAGALAEDLEVRWLQGGKINIEEYCGLANLQRRLVATLGLERRARNVTPLRERLLRDGA